MKLFNIMAIWITLIFTILLIVVLVVSFGVIRNLAKQELYENAQNSATSISLIIGSSQVSQGNIETTINASFDNGNYEKITFVDPDSKIIYERVKDIDIVNIPDWFKNVVVFDIDSAKAVVSDGWQIAGTIEVLNDRSVVYLQLYKIMMNILSYLSIVGIVFLLILAYVFSIILKPLKKIKKQAHAVMNNEFVIQKKEPWVQEFKSVVRSINSMVQKFEKIFQNASNTLSENKELLYSDPVMKIPNRRYFMLKATEYLTEESGNNYGSAMIISVKKADRLNQILGYKKTDEFLFNFAQFVSKETSAYNNSVVGRINGVEIAVLLPKVAMEKLELFAKKVLDYIDNELDKKELSKEELGVFVGICEYEPKYNMNKLFSLLDHTLIQAKLLPYGKYYKLLNNKYVIERKKWKQTVLNGFKNDGFEIVYRRVTNLKTKENCHNTVSFALKNENNELCFYGTFIAPVIELGLIQDVYMHIIKKVLFSNDEQNNIPLSIQVSQQFAEDKNTYTKLKTLFEQSKNKIHKEIIFELPESLINNQFENSVRLIKLFKEFGFGFGINSFMAYSEDYGYLKELKPLFIKADENYILDTQQNISVVKIILDSIGAEFIATGVGEIEKIEKLNKKGVFIVAGAVADKI